MAYEEIGRPRYTRKNSGDGLIFEIPSKKNWFLVLFLGFWLCGWAAGEISVAAILIKNGLLFFDSEAADFAGGFPDLFLLLWLTGWTVGGIFAISAWLWQISGKEIISVSYTDLSIVKSIPVFKRIKKYRLENIRDMRLSFNPEILKNRQLFYGMFSETAGQLAFDYGAKTVHFGLNLEEVEAKQILEEIAERHSNIIQR